MGSIEDFNALSDEEAFRNLYACLASPRWASEVAAGRPYRAKSLLRDAAGILMQTLTDQDCLEAMQAHPRIGERGGDSSASSEREQSRAMQSPAMTLAALAAENRQYEEKFGHVFLIRAGGRSAEEILSELRRRMKNDPATELAEARRELAQIAVDRLSQLVS